MRGAALLLVHGFLINQGARRAHAVLLFLSRESITAPPDPAKDLRRLFGMRVPPRLEPSSRPTEHRRADRDAPDHAAAAYWARALRRRRARRSTHWSPEGA